MKSNYLDKKFPEKIKEFHLHDEKYFSELLDQTSLSITKNMHPIIAYNFPNLLEKLYNESDLSNIDKSPSVILHYKRNGIHTDKINDEQVEYCNIIKKINNKEYTDSEILEVMDQLNVSKRQRATFSKSYPVLHDKFDSVEDNFKYNLCLIAFEQKDYSYIRDNVDFVKVKLLDKAKDEWWEIFKYLDSTQFNDRDLLKHIEHPKLIKYSKFESTVERFMVHHNSNLDYVVTSKYILDVMVNNKIELQVISTDLLEKHAEYVLKHYPYFYEELRNENFISDALCDPYNIVFHTLNKDNVKEFLNKSNIDVTGAYYGLIQSKHPEKYCALLLEELDKFEGIFLALQTYPLFIYLLSLEDYYKHVTPYLINHSCKIDPSMFEFFKTMELNRWNIT